MQGLKDASGALILGLALETLPCLNSKNSSVEGTASMCGNFELTYNKAATYTLPSGSDGKASACSAGDLGSIPGLGRSSGVGHGNPLQYPPETQSSLFHFEVWSFPSTSHSENRRHIDPVWISSQQHCLCPLLSFGPWGEPWCSQEDWLALVLGSYVRLVWMNHRIAYCLFSGQTSWRCLADIELGSPKIMLEVGRRAHSGKVCHLHEGLCVHASSSFPSFAGMCILWGPLSHHQEDCWGWAGGVQMVPQV